MRVTASTSGAPVAAFEDDERKLYGVQWHPEVMHSTFGQQVLENFLCRGAGLEGEWTAANVVDELVDAHPRAGRRGARALRPLRWRRLLRGRGARAEGGRRPADLRLRRPRPAAVGRGRAGGEGLRGGDRRRPRRRRRQGAFLDALAGVSDPEEKRKIIGREFIRVFEQAARDIVGSHRGDERPPGRVPRAGHALPRRRRVRRRHRRGEHQVAPQRRRPPRRPAVQARRAAARALQGRGAPGRPRARRARRASSGASRSPGRGSASASSAR